MSHAFPQMLALASEAPLHASNDPGSSRVRCCETCKLKTEQLEMQLFFASVSCAECKRDASALAWVRKKLSVGRTSKGSVATKGLCLA